MKNNKGVTLIALVVTIVVLLILASITIGISKNINKEGSKNAQIADLSIIQHAVLEQYTKYKIVKDESKLIGTEMTWSSVNNVVSSINSSVKSGDKITLKVENYDSKNVDAKEKYYKINESDLSKLGVSNASSDTYYIINYSTGEVIDAKNKVDKDGEALYTYSIE